MFHVRPDSGEPIYQQLIRQITHAITSGALKPGDRLPTIRRLAAEQVVNPNTVARAYRELERIGLVQSGPRRGTFVTFDPPKLMAKERRSRVKPYLDGLVAEARVLGISNEELRIMLEEALATEGSREPESGEEGP
jgi:GntR family transcriptional regulator